MSKKEYINFRKVHRKKGIKAHLPKYYKALAPTKKKWYPDEVLCTEFKCEVGFAFLIRLTTFRLLDSLDADLQPKLRKCSRLIFLEMENGCSIITVCL